MWLGVRCRKTIRKQWIIWFFVIMRSICELRNKITFQNDVMPLESFMRLVLYRGRSWIEANLTWSTQGGWFYKSGNRSWGTLLLAAAVSFLLGGCSDTTGLLRSVIILGSGVMLYLWDYVLFCCIDVIFVLCWLLLVVCELSLLNNILKKREIVTNSKSLVCDQLEDGKPYINIASYCVNWKEK